MEAIVNRPEPISGDHTVRSVWPGCRELLGRSCSTSNFQGKPDRPSCAKGMRWPLVSFLAMIA